MRDLMLKYNGVFTIQYNTKFVKRHVAVASEELAMILGLDFVTKQHKSLQNFNLLTADRK